MLLFLTTQVLLKRLVLLICILFSLNVFAQMSSPPKSIIFYYQHVDSVRELLVYDRAVLTPSAITKRQLKQLKKGNVETFAYLSIGELHGEIISNEFEAFILAHNKDWNSAVMDMRADYWQQYLIKKTIEYKNKGFDGLFLDTLDSYVLAKGDKTFNQSQQQSLIKTLSSLHQVLPNLMLNRGFDLLDQLTFKATAVIAESLFKGYNVSNNSYYDTQLSGQSWLINQLNKVKASNVEAIVIDYTDGYEKQKQRALAKRIVEHGFTPYVSDGLLKQFGVSTTEPIKRRVLTFFNEKNALKHKSFCGRILSTIIEYKGYVPECVGIENSDLQSIDTTRYQTIVFWITPSSFKQPVIDWVNTWFGKTRLVFLDNLPENNAFLTKLGIQKQGELSGNLVISAANKNIEQQIPFTNASLKHLPIYKSLNQTVKEELVVKDQKGSRSVSVFSAPWGAVALQPSLIQTIDEQHYNWTFEPFTLFDILLALPKIPVPDVTTESGNRILTSHIDGDGFPSKAWMPNKPFSADVIYRRILKKYAIPHTVSIIEAEISAGGLYPKNSKQLENIAKKIFRLPSVELASHTFSHPFFWDDRVNKGVKKYGDSLPVPNYSVDYEREIFGSVDYINNTLAPKDKKVKVLLWSGQADPTADIIDKTLQKGLLNVNGGNTYVVNGQESLTQVYPHIMWHENAVQVYAPVINENLYTELWTENYSGYQRVIETFKLLGFPKRLKPMSIYYHMYSGVYPSSVQALEKIYNWTTTQKSTPLFLSEFAERARTLYETGIGKSLYNNVDYIITSTGIKTLRLPNELKELDVDGSNIAGWNKGPDGRFVSLINPKTYLKLNSISNSNTPSTPYIQSVNGIINTWDKVKHKAVKSVKFSINTHVPLKAIIKNANGCKVLNSNVRLTHKFKGNTLQLSYPKAGLFIGLLECQNG